MDLTKKPVFFQAINIVAFAVTIVVNGLAGSTTLLNGVTSGEVSDSYPTLVTPAGFTFAIWGIIYTLLAVFIVYQLLPKNRDEPFLQKIGLLFALSGLFNVCWLLLWHYDFIVYSVVLMFLLLATLMGIYLRLDVGGVLVSFKERVCVHLPFSVYLGWISIATIANLSVALNAVNWDSWGISEPLWAVLIIVVALALTTMMLAFRKDIAFSLVVVWALIGILSKQSGYEEIVLTAEIAIAVILVAAVAVVLVPKFKR